MLTSRIPILINILLVYASWFVVAYLAAQGKPLLAFLPSLATVALHLIISGYSQVYRELKILGLAAILGFFVELLFVCFGTVQYPSLTLFGGITPPLFMIGLWMAFSTTLNTSLFWLHSYTALSSGIGFVLSGPSYYAGEKLGALRLPHSSLMSFLEIGCVWAVALPLLLNLARRI